MGEFEQRLQRTGNITETLAEFGFLNFGGGVGPTYDVRGASYGAKGDGVTDDTSAIQAAVTAAQAVGGLIYSDPGYTYIVSSQILISSTCRINLNGSSLKAKSTMSTPTAGLLRVNASGVVANNVVIDGNNAAGARTMGFQWKGASGLLYDCTAKNIQAAPNGEGFIFGTGSAGTKAYRLTVDTIIGTGLGIEIADGVEVYEVEVSNCSYAGVYVSAAGGITDIIITGHAFHNQNVGLMIVGAGTGSVPWFKAYDNDNFGVTITAPATNWDFGYLEADRTGVRIANGAGTGLETYAATGCSFGTIKARDNPGYAVALASDGTNPSQNIIIGTLLADQSGAGDGDPAFAFANAVDCHVGYLSSKNHTWAVTTDEGFGSGHSPIVLNERNSVGTINVSGAIAGVIKYGQHIRLDVGRIIARDCYVQDSALQRGLVYVGAAGHSPPSIATDLNVGFVEAFYSTAFSGVGKLPAIAYFEQHANINHNRVLDGFEFQGAHYQSTNPNALNYLNLRPPSTVAAQLAAAEAGETWTNTTNNTTAGQFIQGAQSKKITQVDGGFQNAAFTVSLDLSAMPTDQLFRVWVYAHNYLRDTSGSLADPTVFNDIELRFFQGSAYYHFGWARDFMQAGGQYLYARKMDFSIGNGSPSWALIDTIVMRVFSPTASAFTISIDDIARVTPAI